MTSAGKFLLAHVAPLAQECRELLNDKDALLSTLEARLTDEMCGLALSLREFASRAQAIGAELPPGADLCKLITHLVGLMSLQTAHAIGQSLDKPIFLNGGDEYTP
jgi:hypothetical protein